MPLYRYVKPSGPFGSADLTIFCSEAAEHVVFLSMQMQMVLSNILFCFFSFLVHMKGCICVQHMYTYEGCICVQYVLLHSMWCIYFWHCAAEQVRFIA